MTLILWFCSSMIFCFPLLKNPISMAAMIVVISLCLVSAISVFSSFWFSYVLFLVYVGGLLVMFIYICLVSSNFPFKFSVNGLIFALFCSFMISLSNKGALTVNFLGYSSWVTGDSLAETKNISIFLFLAVLLLAMLLVVVRVSGASSFVVSNEKNS
uniref:NADH dehydrogenase subunit 6 n=1 Tax=Doris odhneri TaxID=54992 RepID=UPI00226CF1F8|nr:NADH dehydrogenase subunit 6 [Doris odhneri]UZI00316.1 NADH dehydrogenase subunit 6 [Doris odhneri]